MADTSYLKNVVEPHLIKWVSKSIGVELRKKRLTVGRACDGRDVQFEFDGVSGGDSIAACVSASMSYKVGQMRKFFMEATLLNRASQLKRRIMVFLSGSIREAFKNQCDGLVDLSRIEAMICQSLPSGMANRVKEIYGVSAAEVGGKSLPGTKVPGRRR